MKKNLFVLAMAASAAASHAETADIERITVTSDFRQATLDQLSGSASVLSAERLNSRQAEAVEDILNIAPNVNFASGASRGRFVQIRGIGERSQFSEPINPSVSFLVDDFDFSGLGAAGVLFDTRQVEVFRGPQSTLFGTGALAGAVKIASNQPTDDQQSHISVRAGNKDTYRFEGATGHAITDTLRYRVALMHNRSDGFTNNAFLNRDDTAGIDETAARLALQWDIDSRTTADISYRWYDIDNGYDAFSLDNTRTTLSDEPGFDRQQTHAVSAKLTQRYDAGQLSVLVTHASHNIGYGYDEDWTYTGFSPLGYTAFDAYYRDVDTQTAEVRFSSSPAMKLFNDSTDWVVGAHYKTTDESLVRDYTYTDPNFASEYSPSTFALYGETTTALNEQLDLVIGLRAEQFEFDYTNNEGMGRSTDTDMVGGKIALQYATTSHLWYGSISRGFKGAGINPAQQVSEAQRFFDAEYNWNYEVGVKGPLLTPDATIRAAVFYMRRDDTQINDYDVLPRADGSAEFIDIIDNADLGTNRGIEVETSWQVTDRWQVQGAIGYLDAKFEGYTDARGEYIDEQQQAQAPRWTINLFSELVLSDSWLWRADMDFKDEYRFSDGHDETSPATVLYNTELVWQNNDLQVSAWVNNVFDKTYYTRGFGGFSNDPRDGYANPQPYYQIANGREFGVTVTYQF